MCFDRVLKVYKRLRPVTIKGYKIFEVSDDTEGLGFEHKSNGNSNRVLRGKWETAVNAGELISSMDHTKYPTGFHVFLTKKAALTWSGVTREGDMELYQALVQVKARGILSRGIQNSSLPINKVADCVTCKELFISKKAYDAAFKKVEENYEDNSDSF